MPDSDALATLKSTIANYLQESFGGFLKDQNDNFILQAGSARLIIAPLDWVDGQTLVKVVALVNMGGGPAEDLSKYLIAENLKLIFGKFSLEPLAGMVFYEHTLLGDFLNRKELEIAVRAIASTADKYDDELQARFGGKKFGEF
jgi:Putative bacterial sensory transduction regulator